MGAWDEVFTKQRDGELYKAYQKFVEDHQPYDFEEQKERAKLIKDQTPYDGHPLVHLWVMSSIHLLYYKNRGLLRKLRKHLKKYAERIQIKREFGIMTITYFDKDSYVLTSSMFGKPSAYIMPHVKRPELDLPQEDA